MRRYESVIILEPDMSEEDVRKFTDRYSQLIRTNNGEVIKIEDLGSRRLAYTVKRKDRGRYILLDYVGGPAVLKELERRLKISEDVMKFLSVKTADVVDLEAFKAQPEARPAEEPVKEAAAETPSESEAVDEEALKEEAQAESAGIREAQVPEEAVSSPAGVSDSGENSEASAAENRDKEGE